MAARLINPDGHVTVPLYHHVAIATKNTQIHLAGQVAWDEHGNPVAPDDLAGQVAQVYRNVAKSLTAAGATFHDGVRFTWCAANRGRGMCDDFAGGVEQASREFDLPRPPPALIGVDILFEEIIPSGVEVATVIDSVDLSRTLTAVAE